MNYHVENVKNSFTLHPLMCNCVNIICEKTNLPNPHLRVVTFIGVFVQP